MLAAAVEAVGALLVDEHVCKIGELKGIKGTPFLIRSN